MNIKCITNGLLLSLALVALHTPAWSEQTSDRWEKVVFHMDDAANARWALLLARSCLDDSPDATIVFVTYGPGVDFLMEDAEDRRGNPFDAAVSSLASQGVEFRICAATLGARKIAKENVMDAASIVPSGIAENARLQLKEGYAYLKP